MARLEDFSSAAAAINPRHSHSIPVPSPSLAASPNLVPSPSPTPAHGFSSRPRPHSYMPGGPLGGGQSHLFQQHHHNQQPPPSSSSSGGQFRHSRAPGSRGGGVSLRDDNPPIPPPHSSASISTVVEPAAIPLSKTPTAMTTASASTGYDMTPLATRKQNRHSYQPVSNYSQQQQQQQQAYSQNLYFRQQYQPGQQQPTYCASPPPLDTKENNPIGSSSNNNNNANQLATHARSKSSVLRSLLHRRTPTNGAALPPPLNLGLDDPALSQHGGGALRSASPGLPSSTGGYFGASPQPSPNIMFTTSAFTHGSGGAPLAGTAMPPTPGRDAALGELLQHQSGRGSPFLRSPRMSREELRASTKPEEPRQRSPAKFSLAGLGIMGSPSKDKSGAGGGGGGEESSQSKFKKPKSASNLSALLSRPKSQKNLAKQAAEDEARAAAANKDKENRSPANDVADEMHPSHFAPPPPIYAQYCNGSVLSTSPRQMGVDPRTGTLSDTRSDKSGNSLELPAPNCHHIPGTRSANPSMTNLRSKAATDSGSPSKPPTSRIQRGTKVLSAIAAFGGGGHSRSKSSTTTASNSTTNRTSSSSNDSSVEMPQIDPKDVDRHLEAMLDRRNIPENQRYKMRNLNSTIKTEFIRQDWAEMSAARNERPRTIDSMSSVEGGALVAGDRDDGRGVGDDRDGKDGGGGGGGSGGSGKDKDKGKRGRGKSFTLGRSIKKDANGGSASTKKGKGGDTAGGRHFRSKSAESLSSDRPASMIDAVTGNSGLLAKIKLQQCPADFVAYLRKVQKPELVEVGKLHKLRLLLRNETVSWTDEFIAHGGMKEIVGLLHRIMEVEWREEHEDALLHENLLCLKALCTTDLAIEYLHSIQDDLFSKLLRMLFDPEKKGPSEFTTRNIITSVLFRYIQSAPAREREARARTVLGHLRDPVAKEEERPVAFVLEMHRERPYRVWCKEAVSVTKEVFWIFLHHLNVVALPLEKDESGKAAETVDGQAAGAARQPPPRDALAYMKRHFPQERPPVPAAPYVGGVEWDATNYLASHLDLLNAILACTPSGGARNELREQLRISGWERCLGGSLRLCKEKFYGSVHDGLRTWVAAAAEDDWDVRDVRYGPPPPDVHRSSPKKPAGAQAQKKQNPAPAPRVEIPRLSLALDTPPMVRTPAAGAHADKAGGGGGDGWIS